MSKYLRALGVRHHVHLSDLVSVLCLERGGDVVEVDGVHLCSRSGLEALLAVGQLLAGHDSGSQSIWKAEGRDAQIALEVLLSLSGLPWASI